MADLRNEYRTYLQTKATVTNLCSTRIRANHLQQGETLPAVVLHFITSDPVDHLDAHSGKQTVTIQVDCHAATPAAVDNLAEQIRLVTHRYRGTWGTTYVNSALVSRAVDLTEPPVPGGELFAHIRSFDVEVFADQAVPTT